MDVSWFLAGVLLANNYLGTLSRVAIPRKAIIPLQGIIVLADEIVRNKHGYAWERGCMTRFGGGLLNYILN
jgi:hypothetical protein